MPHKALCLKPAGCDPVCICLTKGYAPSLLDVTQYTATSVRDAYNEVLLLAAAERLLMSVLYCC